MSLKLIREAHLASTLSTAELKALSIIKDATGAASLADLLKESFAPAPDDFDAWMRVVVGEAQDRGINLNKKAEFTQLVMDVLEQDPANPPLDMQEAIAAKLWQDYKGAKNEVRINKMAAAKEEEEKVVNARNQIAARYAQGPTTSTQDILSSGEEEEDSGFAQALNGAIGTEEEEAQREEGSKWYDFEGNQDPNGTYDANGKFFPERSAVFRKLGIKVDPTEEEEDGMSFLKDVLKDRPDTGAVGKGSFSSHLRGEDEDMDEYEDGDATFDDADYYSADDEDVFTSDDSECECPCADGESDLDAESLDDDMGPPEEELDDESMDDVDADVSREKPAKSYDEEEAVKSFFRQAATAPRNMMSAAIKDIEGEGKSAWTSSNVPKNPHPQKSAAYRAWQRGMLAAAKDALGIVDKPKDAKAKPKKKK
jgi:hypothetical protein